MPEPDPRRRPVRRPAAPPGSAPASAPRPRPAAAAPAGAAPAGARLRRPRAEPSEEPRAPASKRPLLLAAIGGGALVLGIVLFIALRGGDDETSTPPVAATAESANASAATPTPTPTKDAPTEPPKYTFDTSVPTSIGGEGSPAAGAAGTAAPKEAPKPAAAPRMTRPTVIRKLGEATTAADAAALAPEAVALGDADLQERCWTRVLELDPNHAEARTQLDVRRIDLDEELAGWAEIAKTKQRIHLRPFERDAAEESTKSQRAALLARWELARAEIEKRIERARTEPFWNAVDELRLSLLERKFFRDLEYEMLESQPPYALFVEVKGTREEREKRLKEARDSYTPFLVNYDKKIRSYLFPLAPNPPKQDPLFPVFVFLNEQRYHDYSREDHGQATPKSVRAHYEPGKKMSFTYSPVLTIGFGAFQEGTQSLLHELTHAWVDQLASADGGETRDIDALATHWFSEGIAEYMSNHYFERDGKVHFQPWRSGRVAGAYRPPGWRIPCRAALEIPHGGLNAWAAAQVPDLPDDKRDDAIGTISSGFYADMSNFILWLNLKSGANRPAQFLAYAREEMSGNGGLEAFQRCLPKLLEEVPNLDATIDDFVKRIANGKIIPYKEFAEAEAAKPAGG